MTSRANRERIKALMRRSGLLATEVAGLIARMERTMERLGRQPGDGADGIPAETHRARRILRLTYCYAVSLHVPETGLGQRLDGLLGAADELAPQEHADWVEFQAGNPYLVIGFRRAAAAEAFRRAVVERGWHDLLRDASLRPSVPTRNGDSSDPS